jgi:hypothetical protein
LIEAALTSIWQCDYGHKLNLSTVRLAAQVAKVAPFAAGNDTLSEKSPQAIFPMNKGAREVHGRPFQIW